jgi:hypothetical protein
MLASETAALSDETFLNYEGCLSVPNLRGRVRRFAHVRVQAWNRDGSPFERVVRGISAGTFQHEVDHLDGRIFIVDRGWVPPGAALRSLQLAGFMCVVAPCRPAAAQHFSAQLPSTEQAAYAKYCAATAPTDRGACR